MQLLNCFSGKLECKRLPNRRKFYRDKLRQETDEKQCEILEERLEFELELDHSIPCEVLRAHKVQVYGFDNLKWKAKGELLVPRSSLEKRLEFDMGELLTEELFVEDLPQNLLNIKLRDNQYHFKLKPCSKRDPLQYQITSYEMVDGQIIDSSTQIVVPSFDTHPLRFREYEEKQ